MTLRDVSIWVTNLSDYATFAVGLIVWMLAFRIRKYNLLIILLLLTGALKIISLHLADIYIQNMPFYHLIGLVELVFIFWIYQRNRFHFYWLLLASGVILTYILNSIFIQSIYEVNNLALAINQLFILLLGLNFLKEIYQKNDVPDLGRYPFFYLNAGFMIYAAGAFFVYLLSSRIFERDPSDFFHNAWILESLFNLFRLALICIGVTYSRRE